MNYKVQIIAPSSSVKEADRLLRELVESLNNHGFKVKSPIELFAENMHYYANTMEKRLEQLQEALQDPEVDIIWAFRGGYGASEIAEQSMATAPSHRKILIGYSDITVLHGLFNNFYKMPSIHGSVGTSLLDKQGKHIKDIIEILNGKTIQVPINSVTEAAKGFSLKSMINGGNLAILTTMIGTKLHPQTKGKILLLEDVGEKGYSVRRMLNHCHQAGLFNEVGAIILGDFVESDEHLNFAFEDFSMRNNHTPIFKAEGIGHGNTNIPIVLGYDTEIKDGLLSVYSPFVNNHTKNQ